MGNNNNNVNKKSYYMKNFALNLLFCGFLKTNFAIAQDNNYKLDLDKIIGVKGTNVETIFKDNKNILIRVKINEILPPNFNTHVDDFLSKDSIVHLLIPKILNTRILQDSNTAFVLTYYHSSQVFKVVDLFIDSVNTNFIFADSPSFYPYHKLVLKNISLRYKRIFFMLKFLRIWRFVNVSHRTKMLFYRRVNTSKYDKFVDR